MLTTAGVTALATSAKPAEGKDPDMVVDRSSTTGDGFEACDVVSEA
jgi:hypothetical protein